MLSLGSVIRAQLTLQALRVIQQLALIFLLVRVWGELYLSDWVVLMSAAGFFIISDCGIQTVLSNSCISFSRSEDREKLSRLIRRFLGYYLIFIPVLVIISMVCLQVGGLESVLKTSIFTKAERSGVFMALSLSYLLSIPLSVLGSVYAAKGNVAKGIDRVSLQILGQTFLIILSMLVSKNPVVTAVTYPLSTFLCIVAVVYDLSLRYPDISFKPDFKGGLACFKLARIGIFYSVNPFAAYVVQNIPVFYFASFAGSAVVVAVFAATRTLVGLLRQLTTQIANAVGVEIFRQWIHQEMKKSAELYGDANRFLAVLAGLLAGYVLAVATPFLALWTQNKVIADPTMTSVLVATVCLAAPAFLPLALMQINNRPQIVTFAAFMQAVLSCLFVFLISGLHQDSLILAALGGAEWLMSLFIIYHAQKRFSFIRPGHLLLFYVHCLLAALLSYLPAALIFHTVSYKGAVGFFFCCALAGVPLIPILYAFGLTREVRVFLKHRLGVF